MFRALREKEKQHLIEAVEARLCSMMPSLDAVNTV
jgi:hypothetical protein